MKKEVFIIGDSMIKYADGKEVSRNKLVKVRSHPGAAIDDFIHYVRRTVRKKANMIITHLISKLHCLVLFTETTMISRINLMRPIES